MKSCTEWAKYRLKPGFHMAGKLQWKLEVVDIRIVWDERGHIWRIRSVSIFPMHPRFLRWSAMVDDHSRQMKTQICTVGDIGIRQWWISLITNPLICCALVPPSQINGASLENVGQASSEYPINRQNLGWFAKSKIPDRLGSSWHYENQALILPTWRYVLFPCKKLDSSGVFYTIQLIKLILFDQTCSDNGWMLVSFVYCPCYGFLNYLAWFIDTPNLFRHLVCPQWYLVNTSFSVYYTTETSLTILRWCPSWLHLLLLKCVSIECHITKPTTNNLPITNNNN